MKTILALALAGALAACTANPKDPETNVSASDYRAAIARVQSDLAAAIAAIRRVQAASGSARSAAWWDAQVGVLEDAATLCSDALAGSKGATPK